MVLAVPRLSVVMSVFNAERFLESAIRSILNQTFADFEFLILDDGSTDRSADLILQFSQQDPRIRPFLRGNGGLVSALNYLLAESRAPLVARMDADDICLPHRFDRQIRFLNAYPDYGVIGSWSDDIDEHGAPYECSAKPQPLTHADFLQAVAADEPLMCHPVVMYRKATVLNVGGYREAYRHVEDYDLWLRLSRVTKLGSLPERLIRYRHYEQQVSSLHSTQQQIGHAVAYLAHLERLAGRDDPTERLSQLPKIGEFDALFGREGVDSAVRARLAKALLYSPTALKGQGFEHILTHIGEGARPDGRWRAVLRLLRIGEPTRACRLALKLSGVA